MASIVIREVDNTSAGISAANTDIAYVPGYAINGPVNVPTLCESLEDFQAIFGYKPYAFKNNQAYPSEFKSSTGVNTAPKTLMYEAGDYEKSYIYAAELLKLGLPVLFERVLPEQIINGVTYTSEDLIARIYFTKESLIVPQAKAFGTHEVDGETIANVYENQEGQLVYFNTDTNAEETIILVISAPFPGSIYTNVSVNYDSIKLDDGTSTSIYDKLTIVPSAELDESATPEVIRFTTVEADVNVDIPEPIVYYKDIESKYVNFEWLQNVDNTFGYIEPIDMKVVGSYWWNGDPAPALPQSEPTLENADKFIDQAPDYTHKYGIWARDFLYIAGATPAQKGNIKISAEKSFVHYDSVADKYCFVAAESGDYRYQSGGSSWNPQYTTVKGYAEGKVYEVTPNYQTDPIGNTYITAFIPVFTEDDSNKVPTEYSKSAAQVDAMPFATVGANSEVVEEMNFATYMEQLNGIRFDFDGDVKIDLMTLFVTGCWPVFQGAFNEGAAAKLRVYCKNPETGWYEPEDDLILIQGKKTDITEDYFNQKHEVRFNKTKITSSVIITMADASEITGRFAFAINGVKFVYANNTFNNNKTQYSNLYVSPVFDSNDEFTVEGMYDTLSIATFWDYADRLTAKGEYEFKYLTSGAYPVFEYNNNIIANNMIQCAKERGDATAYIDHTNNKLRTCIASKPDSAYNSFVDYARNLGNDLSVYTAMFTPWYRSTCGTVGKVLEMPASFAYLSALANMIQDKPNFLAVAGVERGSIPNFVASTQLITNAMADSYQPRNDVSFNAITNIKPYGYVIWGNRTGKNNAVKGNLTAQSFLNIRQMCSDIKKTIYTAAKTLTFEQNTDILWVNFRSKVSPLLDKMITGNGISGYKFIKKATTEKAKIVAIVKIYPIEPVEDWDITVELSDAGVVVE